MNFVGREIHQCGNRLIWKVYNTYLPTIISPKFTKLLWDVLLVEYVMMTPIDTRFSKKIKIIYFVIKNRVLPQA